MTIEEDQKNLLLKQRESLFELEEAAIKFRKAFVIAVGSESPFAREALNMIDKALANVPGFRNH